MLVIWACGPYNVSFIRNRAAGPITSVSLIMGLRPIIVTIIRAAGPYLVTDIAAQYPFSYMGAPHPYNVNK